MRNVLFVAFLLAVLPCAAIPQGYTISQGDGRKVVFNAEDIEYIFGQPAVATDGLLYITYTYGGTEREFGKLYGTISVDRNARRLTVFDGGYLSEDPNIAINITGKRFTIDASSLERFVFNITEGVYSENNYSFACSNKCGMSALITSQSAYLNLTGRGLVGLTGDIQNYLEGAKPTNLLPVANLYEVRVVQAAPFLTLNARTDKASMFGAINLSSSQETTLIKIEKQADVFYGVRGEGKVIAKSGTNLFLVTKGNGISLFIDNELLELSSGALYIFANKNDYNDCAGKGKETRFSMEELEGFGCGYIDSTNGLLEFLPKRKENRFDLKIIYSAAAPYKKLAIGHFGPTDEESSVILEKKGVEGRMIFTRDNVAVERANWFDFGTSFLAYIYDNTTKTYNRFECNIDSKECFLDYVKVAGFTMQKQPVKCEKDSDCGAEKVCKSKLCVRKLECKELAELGPKTKPRKALDVVFVSDGYETEEEFLKDVKKIVDKDGKEGFDGLLSVTPFKEAKDKFLFYYIFGGSLPYTFKGGGNFPSERYFNSILKQCPNYDNAFLISKKQFRSYASSNLAFISMQNIQKKGKGLLVVHEFGHSFGDLKDEYYNYLPEEEGRTGKPNCLKYDDASKLWGKELADKAKNKGWYGCGGDCDKYCKSYLRPSSNSIMNDQAEAEGDRFNKPSISRLQTRLAKFG